MPRIPIRVEPYSNPQRRQRHFKNKRDQILRALGKASYINGSQFAILWVNSKGESEQYASEIFQGRLPVWFNPEVLNDAQRLVLAQPLPTDPPACSGQSIDDAEGTGSGSLDEELEDDNLSDPTTGWEQDERSARPPLSASAQHGHMARHTSVADVLSMETQTDPRSFSQSNELSLLERRQQRGNMLASGSDDRTMSVNTGMDPTSNGDYRPIVIGNCDEVGTFFETRFRQLQQLVCKIVAKAWIKVIEPKKQTRFPYNRGEESKPSWWPDDVRHKEPDHLMKPERISLLMVMLRVGKVPINRLELATAEVAAFIPPDKIHLLREIYRVAREEERLKQGEISPETKVYVAASAATITGSYGQNSENSMDQDSPLAAEHASIHGIRSASQPSTMRGVQGMYMSQQPALERYGSQSSLDYRHAMPQVTPPLGPPVMQSRTPQQRMHGQPSYTSQFSMPTSAVMGEMSYDDTIPHVPYTPIMPPPHSAHIGTGGFYNAESSPVTSLGVGEGFMPYSDVGAGQHSPHVAGPGVRRHSYAQPMVQDLASHPYNNVPGQRSVYASAGQGLVSPPASAGFFNAGSRRELANKRLSSTTSPMSSTTSSGVFQQQQQQQPPSYGHPINVLGISGISAQPAHLGYDG